MCLRIRYLLDTTCMCLGGVEGCKSWPQQVSCRGDCCKPSNGEARCPERTCLTSSPLPCQSRCSLCWWRCQGFWASSQQSGWHHPGHSQCTYGRQQKWSLLWIVDFILMVKVIMVYKIAFFFIMSGAGAVHCSCYCQRLFARVVYRGALNWRRLWCKVRSFYLIGFRLSLITEKNICNNVGHGCCRVALNKAEVLLKMNNGLTRLENVWGVGDGSQSYLSSQMVMLVKEYLVSADAVEATRCLMDLDVPHYHHELVYQVSMLLFINLLSIVTW